MATSVPRTSRSSRLLRVTMSDSVLPSLLRSTTAPDAVAVSGRRPRIVFAVTVLPEPDSPTIASTSPGATRRLTSSTAFTAPASVANVTDKLSMVTTSLMA